MLGAKCGECNWSDERRRDGYVHPERSHEYEQKLSDPKVGPPGGYPALSLRTIESLGP